MLADSGHGKQCENRQNQSDFRLENMISDQEEQNAGKEHRKQEPEISKIKIPFAERVVLPSEPILDHPVPNTPGEEIAEA